MRIGTIFFNRSTTNISMSRDPLQLHHPRLLASEKMLVASEKMLASSHNA
jgi:hypothetical protein